MICFLLASIFFLPGIIFAFCFLLQNTRILSAQINEVKQSIPNISPQTTTSSQPTSSDDDSDEETTPAKKPVTQTVKRQTKKSKLSPNATQTPSLSKKAKSDSKKQHRSSSSSELDSPLVPSQDESANADYKCMPST